MISKIVRDIPPTAANNRNSEGAFIDLKDGRILFAYSRYGNQGDSDGAAADIYGMISSDNGESFEDPFLMFTHQDVQADNVMSVSFLPMTNGDIGLFCLHKYDADQCRLYLSRSADDVKTWSTPILCTPEEGYYVVNNDRIIRTATGRLLAPAAYHEATTRIDENGKKELTGIAPGVLFIYASDDDGCTWYKLADNMTLPVSGGCTSGVQEPGLLQLTDGRLWCYIRTNAGRQYETFSEDDGKTWSPLVPSWFTSPCSPLSTKHLRDGRILAVWNPIPVYNGRSERPGGVWTGARTPLVYAISTDEGKNWSEPIAIETDENSGYCYVAIHEAADGGILLAYCAGGPIDGSTLNRLRIRKLFLNE